MKQFSVVILLLAISFAVTQSQIIDFDDCDGTYNELPLIDQVPELLEEVPNGKKYVIENTDNGVSRLYFATVKGTPRQAGMAYGGLFKKEIQENIDNIIDFMGDTIREFIKEKLPKKDQWMADLPIRQLIYVALSYEFLNTFMYTPPRYEEEILGIAEGSGIKIQEVLLVNLIPELTRAQCSMAGVWGPATPSGNLVQLRALDWLPDAPINKYPVVTIYHFEEEGSNVFANFAWAGIVGSLAGQSPKIGISEKLWWPVEKNETSQYGTPWMYVLRDVLQFDNNLSESIKRLGEAHRTWKIFVGVGSKEDNQMAGIEYAEKVFNVYNDQNFSTPYTDVHPLMDGVIFWDKWAQPSHHKCFGSTLIDGYGELDAEYLFRVSTALGETGNNMVAVYDFNDMTTYIAYSDYEANIDAFKRPLFKLNMTEWFQKAI